jgi:hypothetical protein
MFVAYAERLPSMEPASRFLHNLGSRTMAVAIVASERLFQAVCGLGGHTLALRFEPTRMSLHCLNCGHNTPGWTIRDRA